MKEQIEFIIDTLETAIEWAEYADDYFKKKHGLEQDRENVKKSIDMLRSIEQQNTAIQARIKDLEANEEKLKREWYVIGSNDNFKALLEDGMIKQ